MKLKRIIILTILAMSIFKISFAQTRIGRLTLINVEKPSNSSIQQGRITSSKYIETRGNDSLEFTKNNYTDNYVSISFPQPFADALVIEIENKSNDTQRVIWDDGCYIAQNKNTYRIVRSGYPQRQSPIVSQVPTPIMKGETIRTDLHVGVMIFATTDNTIDQAKLLLPIQSGNTINEYIFTFKLEPNHRNVLDL